MKDNIIFMLFEEWKDSNDYLIQQWFQQKKKQISEWFNKGELEDYEMIDWSQSSNDMYGIYTAKLSFFDPTFQYEWTFILDNQKVIEGQIDEWQIETRLYAIDDKTGEELNKNVITIKNTEWSIDQFIEIIANSIND